MASQVALDERRTIIGMHYLRAIATILVVVVHCCGLSGKPEYFLVHPFSGFFHFGAGEIDLFFMMSGFIMLGATYNVKTGLPRISAYEFFRRRALRILPMLWIAVISYATLRYINHEPARLYNVVRALVVWPTGEVDPNVVWTIRHEVLYYLIFGLFFIKFRNLFFVGVLWFGAPLILAIVAGDWRQTQDNLISYAFSIYNLEFGLGFALGVLHYKFGWRPLDMPSILLIFALLLIVFALRALIFITIPEPLLAWGSVTYTLTLSPFCVAATYVSIVANPRHKFKPLMFLGDASYSIFLFHPHAVTPVFQVLVRIAPWLPSWAAASIGTVAAVGVGSVVHAFVEKPISARAHTLFHTISGSARA